MNISFLCVRIFLKEYFVFWEITILIDNQPRMTSKNKWKVCRAVTKENLVHDLD